MEILATWERLPALRRLEPGGGRIALTFDDGPDPDATPAVLDALDAAGLRATFFIVGEQLAGNIPLGREIVERGHEPALHGYLHLAHDGLRPGEVRDDLARALGTIEAGTGVRPRWCRPPYGRFSEASHAACHDLGLHPVYWSSWGLDWEAIDPERIAEVVARDLEDGAIVLLHDSARYAPRESAMATARAIGLIADRLRELDLRATTLSDAAGLPS